MSDFKVNLLLGKEVQNSWYPIVGVSYIDNDNKERQIMSCMSSDEAFLKVIENELLPIKENSGNFHLIDEAELSINEDYKNAEDKIEFGLNINPYYQRLLPNIYAKTVFQIVYYKSSVEIPFTKTFAKKLENRDILYYNKDKKIISKNFR